MKQNKNSITQFTRKLNLIQFLFAKDYVIYINFLNENMLQYFKEIIANYGFVNIFYINNIIKESNTLITHKLFKTSNNIFLKGGLYAIVCSNLQLMEDVLLIFSATNIYKDKYFVFLKKNTKTKIKTLGIDLGFITHIKFQSYFFNFNKNFFKFFFFLKNEFYLVSNNLFSRQLVSATIWLYKSFIMISLKIFIFLITCFFFLLKQLLVYLFYANKQSIKS